LLLDDPGAIESPLFRMVPEALVVPLVILATMATVIASQALISGVFSLTTQAIQLGYAPRHRIRHTSATAFGQIYIPVVNWALMAACIALVIGFGSSGDLASAYGVAVTSTMVITTVLFYVVLREKFRWAKAQAVALCTLFMIVDLAFFGANLFKIPSGGWFPLLVAGGMFTLMTTWHTGRRLVFERIRRNDIPLTEYVHSLQRSNDPPRRVPGTAVYLFSSPGLTPPALISNVRHNHVVHEQVVVLSIVTLMRPRVLPAQRAKLVNLEGGVVQLSLEYGFMEDPDVLTGLQQGAASRLNIDPMSSAFILGSEMIAVSAAKGMAIWREHLFAFLVRNATPAAAYFGLPLARTITIATPVEV
jgi:KUP system potassium uptake protein